MNSSALSIYERFESNVRSYCRACATEFVTGHNAILTGKNGEEYIDFLTGCGSLNYLHNDPDMKNAIIGYLQKDSITHSLDFHTEAKTAFLAAFTKHVLLPRTLQYKIRFTGPTGTSAVEAALKLARKITGRTSIVAFTNSFHGVSLGALAATGNQYHRAAAGMSLGNVMRLPFDGYGLDSREALNTLATMAKDPSGGIERPAAILVECVQGEGGLNVASDEWLQSLRTLANDLDSLLVVDDVQAGCGRTGTLFSFEDTKIYPGIVVMAKALSGFGLPLAVMLIKPQMDVWNRGEHNGTFRGNNHAFVTAGVAIGKFWQGPEFICAARQKMAALTTSLATIADTCSLTRKGRGFSKASLFRRRNWPIPLVPIAWLGGFWLSFVVRATKF